eukprot:374563-Pyramimonas_sp.AAC.1
MARLRPHRHPCRLRSVVGVAPYCASADPRRHGTAPSVRMHGVRSAPPTARAPVHQWVTVRP